MAERTFDHWRQVLHGPVDPAALRWLTQWIHGWPVLDGEPDPRDLWQLLGEADHLPWTANTLGELLSPISCADGSPTAVLLRPFLARSDGWLLRRNLGFHAGHSYISDNQRAQIAHQALGDDPDPVSAVALWLAKHNQRDDNLLAASWQQYHTRFHHVCDPRHGGGTHRVEVFGTLIADNWSGTPGELVDTITALVPHPGPPAIPDPLS